MKREYLFGILLAVAGVGIIIWLASRYQPFSAPSVPVNSNANLNTNSSGSNTTGEGTTVNTGQVRLTTALISQHSSITDCWLVINNNVYNVTSYLQAHPGGIEAVAPWCGRPDATTAFATKGGSGNTHSGQAQTELLKHFLGALNSVQPESSENTDSETTTVQTTNTSVTSVAPPPATPPRVDTTIALTVAEVAKHSTTNDCWLVINGSVYNVTSFLRAHPGGIPIVAPSCGQPDATSAFSTKAGQGSHSSAATAELARYRLGALNTTTTSTTINTTTTTTPTVTSGGNESEQEDEEDND